MQYIGCPYFRGGKDGEEETSLDLIVITKLSSPLSKSSGQYANSECQDPVLIWPSDAIQ